MKKRLATLALGLAISASVIAQGPPPPGGQGGFGGGPGQHGGPGGPGGPGMRGGMSMGPNLILAPEVVAELHLSDSQVEQLKRIFPPMGPGRGPGGPGGPPPGGHGGPPPGGQGQGGWGGPPPPGQGGFGGPPPQGGPGGHGQGGPGGPGMGRNWDAELKKILNDSQFKRWKQIELQVQAPMVFMRPDVAEKLGLTDEQRQQMHEALMSLRPPQPPQRGDGPPSREEMEQMHKKMQEHRQQMIQKALSVLSAQQRQTWADMTGKPFKFEPRPPRRPGE